MGPLGAAAGEHGSIDVIGVLLLISLQATAPAPVWATNWCQSVANVAHAAAAGRDAGVSLKQAHVAASTLPDDDARKAGHAVVEAAYRYPALPPQRFAQIIFQACLGANR